MGDWISSLTWRDWLAILGAIVLPLSALNACLSLRGRWKDWQATKSQKGFEKRLKELTTQLNMAQVHRSSLASFLADNVVEGRNILFTFIVAVMMFFWAIYLLAMPNTGDLGDRYLVLMLIIISEVFLVFCLYFVKRTVRFSRNIRNPELLVEQIINLIDEAKTKGFGVKGDDTMIEDIRKREMFTDFERQYITQLVDKSKKLNK